MSRAVDVPLMLKALSIKYNDAPFRIPWNNPGEDFVMPVYRWLPSTGASGLVPNVSLDAKQL